MEIETIENNYDFIKIKNDNVTFIFSTAKNNLDFSRNRDDFKKKIDFIKDKYKLEDIKYLSQTHSKLVWDVTELNCEKILEGDGLITNKFNLGISVFTADCTPVVLYDIKNKVISAIHSGWKGTLNHIVGAAIEKMKQTYDTKGEDIIAIIGPHNRECCYEVSEEMIDIFKKDELFSKHNINKGRYLSLENCIIADLKNKNVKEENIKSLNQCTYCSSKFDFHSYRKDKEKSGRLLTLVFMS
ncbi:peptidoglycan editing factor PgeF [Clostridium frigidicarnis]|uniref:Purine nucleoside phosphorylase n=1 Tax=Clostridium frigidicarnis TaxID=84698 RepID=A0A1I0VPK5_9CLOT|nr:peptidoglycan editing factor PgeF [Clostridium frigidicarnis]SFA77937.1 conserved hypothetical protein [Clostridium frigidicarnis]